MTEFDPPRGTDPAGRAVPTPARQASLREHNLGMVLDQIVNPANAVTAPSRADISGNTGLTRATVSALADQLLAAGLIAELAPINSRRAGRPAVPLVPAQRGLMAIGLEVNVDYLGVRVIDLTGSVLAERVVAGDFRRTAPGPVLAALAALCADTIAPLAAERIPTAGVYVAVPGLVDRATGPLRLAPNLGWNSVDVVGLLASAPRMPDVPVWLANEATLAARAEAEALRAVDLHSFFYVSGEIGIGGATVTGGAVVPGRHGWSGEIGHTLIDPAGPACGCGASGCLEQYAGKDALMRAAGLDLDLPIAALIASADEPDTVAALRSGGHALGVALANTVNLIDVDTIVLGGIYASLTPYLLPEIRRELSARVLSHPWSPVTVRAAASTDYAALTGGAMTVLGEIVRDPNAWIQQRNR